MNESQNPFDENGMGGQNSSNNPTPSDGLIPQQSPYGNEQEMPGTQDTGSSNTAHASSSSSDTASSQPQYGQVKVPEYGAMASQFSPQYNPYVYGKPEERPKNPNQNQQNPQMNAQGGQVNPQMGAGYGNGIGPYQANQGNAPYGAPSQMPDGYGNNPNNAYRPQYNNGQMMPGGPGTPGYQPDICNGVDMNDPVQNPLKGHWDPMAFVSLVLLFLPITFLPAITGAISMWRTKKYHMKGFWVATVCMVLGVIATVFELWLFSKGLNVNDFSQQLLNQYGSGSGGSGGSNGGGSVSA